jgi:hypothetical protein
VPPNSPRPVFNNPQHRRAGCWETHKRRHYVVARFRLPRNPPCVQAISCLGSVKLGETSRTFLIIAAFANPLLSRRIHSGNKIHRPRTAGTPIFPRLARAEKHGDHREHRALSLWSLCPGAPCRLPRPRQGVGRCVPFSGCLLPFQDKIIGTSACELNQASRHKLAATPLWIEQGAHRPGEVGTGPIMASSCAAD